MQAEHSRGNGFIISPVGATSPHTKPQHITHCGVNRLSKVKGAVSGFCSECLDSFPWLLRSFSKKALSVTVALCSVAVFSGLFTIGTGVYHQGKLIAVTATNESYTSALLSAQTFADKNIGSEAVNFSFSTTPFITLKSKVVNGKNLRDELLLSCGKFSRGCTVYSGDTPLFTAKDSKTAKETVKDYIASYAMNGDADLSTKLRYETSVLSNDKISTKKECAALLAQNDVVSVVSVVNTTSDKAIPYETQTKQDASLFIGETVTVTEGKVGKAEVQMETVYENGAKQSSRIITENVVAKPVTQVVRVGTKPKDVLETGVFYPLSSEGVVSSNFGKRWGRMHEGIDIAIPEGTPVIAAECGSVIFAGNADGYGKFVQIDHGHGVVTAYAHLSAINVEVGQTVNSGTQIALSGNTGRSTGPHLHFEIEKDNVPMDPNLYLKKR